MKRKIKKMVTGPAAAAFLLSAGTLLQTNPVLAAFQYTPVAGTQTSFDKYLIMDKEAEIPNVEFTYSIAPGAARTYDVQGKKFEVLAGVGTPTMTGVGTSAPNTIAFSTGDGSDADSAHEADDLVKNLNTDTSKYAKKTAVLDFSGCSYTEPGVYRYVITENGVNQGVTNDPDLTKVLDVYVMDEDGALKVQSYVLHANENDLPMGAENGTYEMEAREEKPQGYTNVYDTANLTIRKQVAGNQASHDKYFEFTLHIENAVPGTVYNVVLDNADPVSASNAATISENEGKTNPTVLTVGEDGTLEQKFYLQHNQQITVNGLAKDTAYTVTENPEDYKSTASTEEAPVVAIAEGTQAADTEGTIETEDLTTGYLNEREGIVPTGVVMAVTPFAAVTLLGGFGAATVVMKKKKVNR